MKYRKGYKYQVAEIEHFQTDIFGYEIESQFISLKLIGILTIKSGYAWDGPSGPTLDTDDFMRGSLGHDALYQLIRERHLPQDIREKADDLMKVWCLEDGMIQFRADYCHAAVREFAEAAADPKNIKEVFEVGNSFTPA